MVEEGDMVEEGQTLFEVRSTNLIEQLRDKQLRAADLLYPLNEKNNLVLSATKPGILAEILYTKGSFVPANSTIANIIDTEDVSVVARFLLPRRDFGRVDKQSRIEVQLPDGSKVNGTVSSIEVLSQDDIIEVELKAVLERYESTGLELTSGAPVNATLYLSEDTLYKKLQTYATELYRKYR